MTFYFDLKASDAFFPVRHNVIFLIDSLKSDEDAPYNEHKSKLDDLIFNCQMQFYASVLSFILNRAGNVNHLQTQGKPRFISMNACGKSKSTSPNYHDGVAYCKDTILEFLL